MNNHDTAVVVAKRPDDSLSLPCHHWGVKSGMQLQYILGTWLVVGACRAQELAEKDGQGLKKDLDAARKAPKRKPEKECSEGGGEKKDVPLTEEEAQELTTLVQTIHDLYAQEGPVRPVNAQKAFAVLEVAKEVLSLVRAKHSPVKLSSSRLAEQ